MKYLLVVALFALVACNKKNNTGESIVANPYTADSANGIDTMAVAQIEIDEPEFDFGTVTEGDIVKHSFIIRNTGKVPLVIHKASPSCGCTVPTKPDKPIEPGEQGEIYVEFNSSNRSGPQFKSVTITSNTRPNQHALKLKGVVVGKNDVEGPRIN